MYVILIIPCNWPLKKEEVRRATYYMLPRKKNTPTPENEPHISLNFTHRLAKVILKFVNMEKEPLEVSDVRIEGMQTAASFNIQTDVLTVDESSVATNQPLSQCYNRILRSYHSSIGIDRQL